MFQGTADRIIFDVPRYYPDILIYYLISFLINN